MNRIAETVANSLYPYQPDILVMRWWAVPGRILVGGSLLGPDDWEHLRRDFGITHVLNVEVEHDDEHKMPPERLLQARFADDGMPIPTGLVRAIADWGRVVLSDQSTSVYCHCQMGGSRSPAAAYLLMRAALGYESREAALAELNVGFCDRAAASTRGTHTNAESLYGWHPVHQNYLNSIDAALAT